jgi:hypothetical protein
MDDNRPGAHRDTMETEKGLRVWFMGVGSRLAVSRHTRSND